jgi:hypothetical protein
VNRYFRSTPDVYLLVCSQLDSAYGYPNESTRTQRTLPAVADLPSDNEGRLYLAISAEYCGFELPSQLLPQLIDMGAVEEITEQQYGSVMPKP